MTTAINMRGERFDDGEDDGLPVCECGEACTSPRDRICDECWYAERRARQVAERMGWGPTERDAVEAFEEAASDRVVADDEADNNAPCNRHPGEMAWGCRGCGEEAFERRQRALGRID